MRWHRYFGDLDATREPKQPKWWEMLIPIMIFILPMSVMAFLSWWYQK